MKEKANRQVVQAKSVSVLLKKIPLTMRITLALIALTFHLAVASSYAQEASMSLNMNRVSIGKILTAIEKQTQFRFYYNNKLVDTEREVSINVQNEDVFKTLDRLFAGSNVIYKVVDKDIILTVEKAEAGMRASQKDNKITGTVTDERGDPIIGANVSVKGTTNGTITDIDGKFNLNAETGQTLVITYIGYSSKELALSTQTNYAIIIKESTQNLDEVVVVGYGTQKKVNLTGAVSQISSDMLENRPVGNVGQALQGIIPNLNVKIANGAPNTEPTFNIRGGTSINLNNQVTNASPLILVDGVELNINMLNPDDIESVTILKDAASAAIYGARAAYGVMLVTTKKGSKGDKISIDYSTNFQWNKATNLPDFMDSYNIQKTIMEAKVLQALSVTSDDELFLERLLKYQKDPTPANMYYNKPDGTIMWCANTNPYKEALKKSALQQKHTISINGGTQKSSYFASFGYQDQDGIYKINSDKFKRYNGLINLSSDILPWWKVNLKVSYNKTGYDEPVNPPGKGYWWKNIGREWYNNIWMPIKTPIESPVGAHYTNNVLAFMDYGSRNIEENENIVFTAATEIDVYKGLVLKGDISYKSYNSYRKEVVPELPRINTRWNAPINTHSMPDHVQKWNSHTDYYVINLYANYNNTFGKHSVGGVAGFNQEWTTLRSFDARRNTLLTPNLGVISQALGDQYASDSEGHWAIRGAFFRVNYDFMSRYLIEMNGRYDGTSKFSTIDRFKFFPSISIGWRISEEEFMKNTKMYIDNLKVRASYGSLGNQNVDNYMYISSYGTTPMVDHVFGTSRPAGITPPGLVNSSLTWETASTIDFGLDVMLLGKLDMSFDWYQRTTYDILTAAEKLPSVLGATVPTKNSGELETQGWELSIKWNDRLENGLNYSVGLLLSDYSTKVKKFSGNPNKLISSIYTGHYMGDIWGYETSGFFQNPEDVSKSPSQTFISTAKWYPGDIKYSDIDGSGKIDQGKNTADEPGDKKILGNSTPRYQFGITTSASWKGFDLGIILQGIGKQTSWIGNELFWGYIDNATPLWNVYNDSWTPDRNNAYFPAHTSSAKKNKQIQSKYLQNTAYMRIKDLTLGYTLPSHITKKAYINKLRVFFSGYNLGEITGIRNKQIDPEVLDSQHPILRSYSFGLQIGF